MTEPKAKAEMKFPPRVRGYVCLCDDAAEVAFCPEQWETGPFKWPLQKDDHTFEYLSLQEHDAILAEKVAEARAATFEEAAAIIEADGPIARIRSRAFKDMAKAAKGDK